MKLALSILGAYCATDTFVINGVVAQAEDFGISVDEGCDTNEYCGDRQFTGVPPTARVLAKYSITLAEYAILVGQLEVGLSFGRCSLCD